MAPEAHICAPLKIEPVSSLVQLLPSAELQATPSPPLSPIATNSVPSHDTRSIRALAREGDEGAVCHDRPSADTHESAEPPASPTATKPSGPAATLRRDAPGWAVTAAERRVQVRPSADTQTVGARPVCPTATSPDGPAATPAIDDPANSGLVGSLNVQVAPSAEVATIAPRGASPAVMSLISRPTKTNPGPPAAIAANNAAWTRLAGNRMPVACQGSPDGGAEHESQLRCPWVSQTRAPPPSGPEVSHTSGPSTISVSPWKATFNASLSRNEASVGSFCQDSPSGDIQTAAVWCPPSVTLPTAISCAPVATMSLTEPFANAGTSPRRSHVRTGSCPGPSSRARANHANPTTSTRTMAAAPTRGRMLPTLDRGTGRYAAATTTPRTRSGAWVRRCDRTSSSSARRPASKRRQPAHAPRCAASSSVSAADNPKSNAFAASSWNWPCSLIPSPRSAVAGAARVARARATFSCHPRCVR